RASEIRLARALDCAQRSPVGAAAANEAVECLLDLRIARMRIAVEQLDRRHDPTADAVAALVHLLFDPGLLHAMRIFRRADTGERGDLARTNRRHGRDAGAHRTAVDMDCASTALAEPAAEAWIVQRKVGAQRVE